MNFDPDSIDEMDGPRVFCCPKCDRVGSMSFVQREECPVCKSPLTDVDIFSMPFEGDSYALAKERSNANKAKKELEGLYDEL